MTSTLVPTSRLVAIAAGVLTLVGCGGGAPKPDAAQQTDAKAAAEAELEAQRAELEKREAELAEKQKALEEERDAAEAARRELERAEAEKAEAARATATRPASAPRPAASRATAAPPAAAPASSLASVPAPAPAPKVAQPIVVPSGTALSIAFTSTISTKTAKVGDPIGGRLTAPLIVDGRTIAPTGAAVRGSVTDVYSGSQEIGGTPRLAVRFDELSLGDGRSVAIAAELAQKGKSESGRDAAKIAGGALLGAVVGKQIDDGKGAVIGGLLGGAAGAAIAQRTGGDLEIADGTVATLVLTRSVEIR